MNLDQIEKKYLWIGGIIFTLLLLLVIKGCHNKFPANAVVHETASPKISLSDPLVTALGKLDGPYAFAQCLTPTIVKLTNLKTKGTEDYQLFGLSDVPYAEPTPTPTPGGAAGFRPQATPMPTEDPAVVTARLNTIKNFKMEELKKLFDTRQLWLVRMSDQSPARIYLFLSDRTAAPDKPITGLGTLVNALALRKGVANMDLSLPGIMNQPLSDMMLECQLASYQEAQGKKSGGEELWTKFKMPMPDDPLVSKRLEEIKKSL